MQNNEGKEHKESSPFCFKKLEGFDVIGFDFDFCLARYNIPNVMNLIHWQYVDFLVHHRKWPGELLKTNYDEKITQMHLYIHKETGLFLKLDKDRRVVKASFGRRFLNNEEIRARFPKPLENMKSLRCCKSKWKLPIITIMADLIEILNLELNCEISDLWQKLNDDISAAGYLLFYALEYPKWVKKLNPKALEGMDFSKFQPKFFDTILASPGKFLERANRLALLKALRSAGFKTFVITDSRFEVAETHLKFLFGNEYNQLFDIIITHGQKSRKFWKPEMSFREAGVKLPNGYYLREDVADEVKEMEQFKTYGCGNKEQLTEFLAELQDKKPEDMKILFLGDSLNSDILSMKKSRYNWSSGYSWCGLEETRHLDLSIIKEHCPVYDKVSPWGNLLAVECGLTYFGAQLKKEADLIMADVLELGGSKNVVETADFLRLLENDLLEI